MYADPALYPSTVLLDPVVIVPRASAPTTVLLDPVVAAARVPDPIEVLSAPEDRIFAAL